MSEDDKAPAMTIRIPAPRVLAEAAARRPDARTAEVLRALHRAKGTITGTDVPTSSPSTETLAWELRALREWLSKTSPIVEEAAQRLASCAGILERAVIVPSEKLDDFQRSQDGAVRELREAVHGLTASDGCPGGLARLVGEARGCLLPRPRLLLVGG